MQHFLATVQGLAQFYAYLGSDVDYNAFELTTQWKATESNTFYRLLSFTEKKPDMKSFGQNSQTHSSISVLCSCC